MDPFKGTPKIVEAVIKVPIDYVLRPRPRKRASKASFAASFHGKLRGFWGSFRGNPSIEPKHPLKGALE